MTIDPTTSKIKSTPEKPYPTADNLISLLGVYATQFGSYTTLVWQVPALSLTAQSFLLTIALGSDSTKYARLIASGLSVVISWASYALLHDQRGHAINHGELAKRISEKLDLKQITDGDFTVDDAKPVTTNAEIVWTAVDHLIYGAWRFAIALFFVADLIIIISVLLGRSWFIGPVK
jgi:hypothetical protein